jgi:nuclear pore complex protein Nup160
MEAESLIPAPRVNSFIETRLDLDAIDPVPSITEIHLPSTSAFSRQTHPIVKSLSGRPASKDETEFQKRNAATAASIFFRAGLEEDEKKYPRAISWRVVEGASTLEVRALDLTRPESQPDGTNQILRYVFPSPICTGGVALADSIPDGAVYAFVMTKNYELYTLTLDSSLFTRAAPASEEIGKAFKYFRPSALSISTFYKLFASSSRIVFISLGDGRFSRLSRKDNEDGSQWTERTYDDGQWAASFRGLLPWHPKPTIQHEGSSLNLKTVHMAISSPDQEHVLTTGLDHTLKAWNLSTGKPTIVRDILNQPLPEDGLPKRSLDPGTTTSLRLFESRSGGGFTYYVVTFSPQKSGLFKFWAIADPDDPDQGIRDCFDDKDLKLPDPGDGALWTLSDFDIRSAADTSEIDVWMLMRLNKRFKLFHRKFHDIHNLGEGWDAGWEATIVDSRRHGSTISPHESADQADLSARWLDHIFRPGQFATKVIETALSVYTQAKTERSKVPKGSLRDRVLAVVASQISRQISMPRQSSSRLPDAAAREWSNFWNILRDVNSLRWEPVSLALDGVEATPWVAFADGFSVVRDCSDLELLTLNEPEALEDINASRAIPSIEMSEGVASNMQEQASVLSSAATFRSSFSPALQRSCERAFDEELWTAPLNSPADRMQSLYDKCNFAEDITSHQFEEIRSSLEDVGGFAGLRSHHFRAISENQSSRKEPKLAFNQIGLGALVCGAQDMISLQLGNLQNLTYLLVFIFGEVDPAEELAETLELEGTFLALVEHMKQAKLAYWLATKSRTSPVELSDPLPRNGPSLEMTVLRDLFAPDIKPHTEDVQDGRSGLTQAIQHLLSWVAGGNEICLDDAVVSIQCDLLRRRNLELATSFQSFLPATAWSTYVQGRLCLLREEFSEAAVFFRHAAFRLCAYIFLELFGTRTDHFSQPDRIRPLQNMSCHLRVFWTQKWLHSLPAVCPDFTHMFLAYSKLPARMYKPWHSHDSPCNIFTTPRLATRLHRIFSIVCSAQRLRSVISTPLPARSPGFPTRQSSTQHCVN